ncbi:hypothetical protein ABDK10_03880 [Staphylococcus aureus]
MFLNSILFIIIALLIVILVINYRTMQQKLDTETYSKDQLVNKISKITSENTKLKNQMLNIDANNDTHHHSLRKAKQDLIEILSQYKKNDIVQFYEVVATSGLAVRHPLFEYARTFDYIVITNKGLFNINVKNWKQKTFYHFNVDPNDTSTETELNTNQSINQTVGRYIASQYHTQFHSSRQTTYTFIERIKNNSVIFDFYNYDPYEQASQNAKILEDKINEHLNRHIKSIGLVYFTDGSVNIIDGPTVRNAYAETVSSKSSLKEIIGETLASANETLSEDEYQQLLNQI